MASQTNPTSTGSNSATRVVTYVSQQLEKTRRQVKTTDLISALLKIFVFTVGFLMVVAVWDSWIMPLSSAARWCCFSVIILFGAYIVGTEILPLLFRRINPEYAAKMIEDAEPSFKNSLLNFVFLKRKEEEISPVIFQAVSRQAATNLSAIPADATVDRSSLIRLGLYLSGLTLLIVLYMVFSPKDPLQSFARVLFPNAKIAHPARVRISEVVPADATVFFGDSLTVTAVVRGNHHPDDVFLLLSSHDGQIINRKLPMESEEIGGRYRVTIGGSGGGIQQALTYQVVALDGITPLYDIRVQSQPTIAVETLTVEPPRYTSLPAQTFVGQGEIDVIEGTRVTVQAIANLPIKNAYLDLLYLNDSSTKDRAERTDKQPRFRTSQTLNMEVQDRTAKIGFFALLDASREKPMATHYQLRFVSTENDTNRKPNIYPIKIYPDLAPEIRFTNPTQQDVQVPEDGQVMVDVEANDLDFEIAYVLFHLNHQGLQLRQDELEIQPINGNQRVRARYRINPQALGLKSGDRAVFFASAADNRTTPGDQTRPDPNISRTDNYTLTITDATRPPQENQADGAPPAADQGEKTEEKSTQPPDPQDKTSPPVEEGDKQDRQSDSEKQQQSESTDSKGTENQQSAGTQQQASDNAETQDSQQGQQQQNQQQGSAGQSDPGKTDQAEGGEGQGASGQSSDSQSSEQSKTQETGGSSSDQGTGNQGENSTGGQQQSSSNDNRGDSTGDGSSQQNKDSSQSGTGSDSAAAADQQSDSGTGNQQATTDANRGEAADGMAQQQDRDTGTSANEGDSADSGQSGSDEGGSSSNQGSGAEQGSDPQGTDSRQPLSRDASQREQFDRLQELLNDQNQTSGDQNSKGDPQSADGSDPANQRDSAQSASDPQGDTSQTSDSQESTSGGDAAEQSQQPPEQNSKQSSAEGSDNQQSQENPGQSDPQSGQSADSKQTGQSETEQKDSAGGKQETGEKEDGKQQGADGQATDSQQADPQKKDGQAGDPQSSDSSQGGDSQTSEGQGGQGDQSDQQQGGGNQKADDNEGNQGESQSSDSQSQSTQQSSGDSSGQAQASDRQGGDSQGGNQAGSDPKNQGTDGQATSPGTSAAGSGSGAQSSFQIEKEDPNLEHAKQATDLILKKLDEQKYEPDPKLLEQMNWSPDDLNNFLKRWEEMKRAAEQGDARAKRRYEQTLRSLNFRSPSELRNLRQSTQEIQGLSQDSTVIQPPPQFAPDFQATLRDLNRNED